MAEKNINGLLAVFFTVLVAGFVFHESETFAGSLTGHLIGIAGSILMVLTLVYSFKKRVLGKRGKKNPLNTHIFYGLMGPSLVIIHSAHKLGSLIGLLVFTAMLIVVFSGITGRYLFRKVNRTLKEQQNELAMLKDIFQNRREEISACRSYFRLESKEEEENSSDIYTESDILDEAQRRQCNQLFEIAQSISELQYSITFFDSTKSLFSKWLKLHHLLTLFLFSLMILHILTVLYYGLRWIP